MQGQTEEAVVVGEQMAKLYPNSMMIPILGYSYLYLGRYKEVLDQVDRWLERAGSRHFDVQRALDNRGNACLGLGDFEAAERALREAAGTPPSPQSLLSLIVALAHQGRLDEARAEYKVYRGLSGPRTLDVVEKSLRRNYRDPAYIEMYLRGLQIAGLE